MGASTIAATPSADLTALSTELLEAEVVGLAGRIAAASAQLLGLIAELDRRSAWGTWGCRSIEIFPGNFGNTGNQGLDVGIFQIQRYLSDCLRAAQPKTEWQNQPSEHYLQPDCRI
jgi:hypothetical protein